MAYGESSSPRAVSLPLLLLFLLTLLPLLVLAAEKDDDDHLPSTTTTSAVPQQNSTNDLPSADGSNTSSGNSSWNREFRAGEHEVPSGPNPESN